MNFYQSVTLLLTVLAAAPFGLVKLCIALLIRPCLLLPLPLVQLHRYCDLRYGASLIGPAGPLAAATFMGLVVWGARPFIADGGAVTLVKFLSLVIVGAAAYLLFLQLILPHQLRGLLRRAFVR